jgi:Flp pilus assembly protein TadD
MARPDDFANHTNLGNYYLARGDTGRSIQSFETALRLRPKSVGTLVNASIAYSRAGRAAEAEKKLDAAVRIDPENAPALFNLGLLLAETGRMQEAESNLRHALQSDPAFAPAAYNLCVMLGRQGRPEGLDFCRRTGALAPASEDYAVAAAYFLDRDGRTTEAIETLDRFASAGAPGARTQLLMGGLCVKVGRTAEARKHYRIALAMPDLPAAQRPAVAEAIAGLKPGTKSLP